MSGPMFRIRIQHHAKGADGKAAVQASRTIDVAIRERDDIETLAERVGRRIKNATEEMIEDGVFLPASDHSSGNKK